MILMIYVEQLNITHPKSVSEGNELFSLMLAGWVDGETHHEISTTSVLQLVRRCSHDISGCQTRFGNQRSGCRPENAGVSQRRRRRGFRTWRRGGAGDPEA